MGLALLVFLRPVPTTWVLLGLAAALAAVVTWLMRRFVPFPTYTAPFVLVTWLALLLVHGMFGPSLDTVAPPLPSHPKWVRGVDPGRRSRGHARVERALTGLLFLVGIAISNWRHAILALVGSIVGTLQAAYHNDPSGSISLGGSTAITRLWPRWPLGCRGRASDCRSWRRSCRSSSRNSSPKRLGIPALTAPFVVASWIVLTLMALDPVLGQAANGDSQRQGADHPEAEVN